MTFASVQKVAVRALCAIAAISLLASVSTHAGGKKEFYSETYRFDKATDGYEGRAGDYYCSYIKTPVRKCDKNGRNCKVVAWNLEQRCQ